MQLVWTWTVCVAQQLLPHTHNRCLHQSMINWWNYPRRLGRLSPQRGANEASSTLWLSKMQSTTDALLCPALPCRVLWRVGVNNNMKLQQQRTGDFVGGKKRFAVFALLWFELFWFDVISQRCSLMFFDTHQHTLHRHTRPACHMLHRVQGKATVAFIYMNLIINSSVHLKILLYISSRSLHILYTYLFCSFVYLSSHSTYVFYFIYLCLQHLPL